MSNIIISKYTSPAGTLWLGSLDGHICLCDWRHDPDNASWRRIAKTFGASFTIGRSQAIEAAEHQLDEYFRGLRKDFDLPLTLAGTPFQQSVWQQLSLIGYGSTASYAQIAAMMGKPSATRAVAAAIGANPISIFIPCHRVVGSDGKLTGYRGGLEAKQVLLGLERANTQPLPAALL